MKLMDIFLNIFFILAFLILTPIFLVIAFPVIFLPASFRFRNFWFYKMCGFFSGVLLAAGRIKFSIKNKQALSYLEKHPAIIVLNHQSCLDALVAEKILAGLPRIVFSNDYTRRPLLGQILQRMHVVVRRMSAKSSHDALNTAIFLARSYGNHVVIFPEGTRHADGHIHKFYRGFTVLAEELGRPVIPVLLNGLHKVMPRGSRFLQHVKEPIDVVVGEPIFFDPSRESREEFLDKVHNWFKLNLGSLTQK